MVRKRMTLAGGSFQGTSDAFRIVQNRMIHKRPYLDHPRTKPGKPGRITELAAHLVTNHRPSTGMDQELTARREKKGTAYVLVPERHGRHRRHDVGAIDKPMHGDALQKLRKGFIAEKGRPKGNEPVRLSASGAQRGQDSPQTMARVPDTALQRFERRRYLLPNFIESLEKSLVDTPALGEWMQEKTRVGYNILYFVRLGAAKGQDGRVVVDGQKALCAFT